MTMLDFEIEDDWHPVHKSLTLVDLIRDRVCRDCGRSSFSWEHGCGGARPGVGSFELCDDCAALDGRGQRSDGAADCSHWGLRTTDEEATQLSELQAKRRAKYRARQQRMPP